MQRSALSVFAQEGETHEEKFLLGYGGKIVKRRKAEK